MLVPIETLGAEIKARVEAGDKAFDKAEQHYISAGIQLAEARARLAETKEMLWSAFLYSHVRLKERRVRELLALADGRTTLAEMREKTRERVAAHRERRKDEAALRNAEPMPADVKRLQEKLKEQASIIKARDDMVAIAERQSQEAHTRAMFAEADKERLEEQVAKLKAENAMLREENARLLQLLETATVPLAA